MCEQLIKLQVNVRVVNQIIGKQPNYYASIGFTKDRLPIRVQTMHNKIKNRVFVQILIPFNRLINFENQYVSIIFIEIAMATRTMDETQQELHIGNMSQMLWDPIDELDIQVNKNNKEDYQQVIKILTEILQYPSIEQAETHMQAARLGTQDLSDNIKQRSKQYQENQEREELQYCPCCGFVKQDDNIKLCTPLRKISNIGISTYLYFQTIKNLVILLSVMTAMYSIFSLVTNIIASENYSSPTNIDDLIKFYNTQVSWVSLSLGSKQVNQTDYNKLYYFISACIGAAMMIVWLLMLFCLKYYELEEQNRVDEESITASDFTIVIEGVPKDITLQELQIKFDAYEKTVNNVPAYLMRPFKIQKINIGKPFYLNNDALRDEETEEIKKKHEEMIELFAGWIEERQSSMTFSTPKQERDEKYKQFQALLDQENKKYRELEEKIEEKIREESQVLTTTIFVTMSTSHAVKVIGFLNDSSFAAKARYYLTCCQAGNPFKFTRNGQEFDVKVERAPEPEDIIWSNLGVSSGEIFKRKLITYFATLILLGISFAIIYGLSLAQINNENNQILSLAISSVISLINVILVQVIRRLSIMQKDYTETKHQTSLAIKSIIAQMINSILIPILVNKFIKDKIYSENGLASDVFMLGLTNSFISPIILIFNPFYIMNRFKKWLYARSANKRLLINQPELNSSYEYLIFEPGFEYVYLVNLFLFVCFFVSLQPIISMFAIAGMGMMYWGQKHSLFNRTKRPVPGTDLINVAMSQIILTGGIIYSLGSLTWSNFFPEGIPKYALLPNLIALGISVLMALLPYRAILSKCFEDQVYICHEYKKCRMIFPSEYDRLNPVTSTKGFEQYMNFIKQEEERYKNASEEEKKKIAEELFNQSGPQQRKTMMPPMMMNNGPPGLAQSMAMRPPQMMMNGPRFPPIMQSPFAGMRPPMMRHPMMGHPMMGHPMMRPPGFTPTFVPSWNQQHNGPRMAPPPNYINPNIGRQMQQGPPPAFQQGHPPGLRQGPPPGYQQGFPPGFRPPPGLFQPPPPQQPYNSNNRR